MTEFTTPVPEAPRFSIGNVVSQTFSIYSRNFIPFFLLAFVVSLPSLLVQLSMLQDPNDPTPTFAAGSLVAILLSSLLNLIVTASILYGVYQQMRGQRFTVGRSLQIAAARLLPIIGVSIVSTFIIWIGLILLVIPGIILALMLMVAVPAIVVERVGVFDALSRSKDLTEGHRLELLGLIVLYMIIMWIVMAVVGVVLGMITGFGTGVLWTVLWQAFSVAIGLISSVGLGVLYYELRRSKEGLDLNDLASVFE